MVGQLFFLESSQCIGMIDLNTRLSNFFADMDRPIIDYPCSWSYCLIGVDEGHLRQAIADCLGKMDYRVAFSHRSAGGKYVSLNVETVVVNESARDQIYEAFYSHVAITRVI